MNEPASTARMSVPEFLRRDDGSETRYELVHGHAVAMNPPADPHGTIAANAAIEIDRYLEDRPSCRAAIEAGVWVDDENYYVADVVATCVPPAEDGIIREPFLIVEVLSSSNDDAAFKRKIDAYIQLPWVEEIWLIDSRKRWVQPWRRGGPDQWIVALPLTGTTSFASPALEGAVVTLDRLYRKSGLDEAGAGS